MLVRRPQRGFTLVESMIVVAIMAIFIAIALPSFTEWLENSKIRTTADSLLNGIQLAKTESLGRNTRTYFALGAGSSWTVGCVTAISDLDGDGVDDCPAVIQSRPTSEGGTNIALTVTPVGATQVTFVGVGRVRTPNPDGSNPIAQLDIDSTRLTAAQSRNLRILISSGGEVKLCDPNVTTVGDARAC